MKSLILFTLLLLATPRAQATVEGTTLIRNYDDTRTQVVSPSATVSGGFDNDKMKVTAGWAEDIVSSASADVVTFSSKGEIHDTRKEYSGSLETLIPDGSMGVGYVKSDENDYHSQTYNVSATREFFQKNTIVGFGFADGHDHVKSSSDLSFDKPMHNNLYSISVTQILSRKSLIEFLYDFRVENGYLASPYRRAKFIDASGSVTSRPENHPETRNRNAWAVKYNYYADQSGTAFATVYRLYQDSWDVVSHTLEETITKELGRHIVAALNLRYYTQSQAKFFNNYYSNSGELFYTGNLTLAAYDAYSIGIKPVIKVNDHWNVQLTAEYYTQNFKDAIDAGNLTDLSDDKKMQLSAMILGLGIDGKF